MKTWSLSHVHAMYVASMTTTYSALIRPIFHGGRLRKSENSPFHQIPRPSRPPLQPLVSSLSRVRPLRHLLCRRPSSNPPDTARFRLGVPSPLVLMSATSSSISAARRRALLLLLICCLSCKEKVCIYVSTMEKHDWWIFYKC